MTRRRSISKGKVLEPTALPGVGLHPNRPEKTGPRRARAVTIGQNIYFHPGQYRPGTIEGDDLIAHELAHTLQNQAAEKNDASTSGCLAALERNADALGCGERVPVLPAASNIVLCSPFDSETGEEQVRRERLLQSIGNASNNVLRLLQTGGLVQRSEAAQEQNGVRGVSYYPGSPNSVFESLADREARLRRILRLLMAMARQYRSGPIPSAYSPPTPMPPEAGGGYQSATVESTDINRPGIYQASGGSAAYADLQGAYAYHCFAQHLAESLWMHDWLFLDPNVRVIPGALRGVRRVSQGIQTGINIVVPDIDLEPLRYWRLTGFERIPQGATIVELWHDEFGYYYMHRSQRIDVPYRSSL